MTPDDVIALRHKLGLSQDAFASLIDCNPRTVCQWEQGINQVKGLSLTLLQAMEDEHVVKVIKKWRAKK